jgi:hypothetical protein
MKTLIFICLLVLIGCKKEQCKCSVTFNHPIQPRVFYTTEPYKYEGVKEYTDKFGNHIIETTVCDCLTKMN